jgi:hypothetical protein
MRDVPDSGSKPAPNAAVSFVCMLREELREIAKPRKKRQWGHERVTFRQPVVRSGGAVQSQSLPGCAPPLLGALKAVSGLCSFARPGPRRISFATLKLGRKLFGLCGSPRGMASEVGAWNFR